MAVGESNGDKTYNDKQLSLYDRYDIKFKIKINYDTTTKLKTASRFPPQWTDFTTNMCKKEEKQIAFLTGEKNNLTVIDLDVYNPNKQKDEKYKNMNEDEYGVGLFKRLMEIDELDELEDCIVVQTPSGGYHIYCEYLKELPNTNDILPKIDVRNDGGCIFFTVDHKIMKYSNDVDTQVSKSFLRECNEYKSKKDNAEKQMREIAFESTIREMENESEYIDIQSDDRFVLTILSKLMKDRFESYDSWIRIGFIVFNELGDRGFDIWHSFSKKASNYKSEEDCRFHWNSFQKKEKRLTIRTLFYYLKEDNKTAFNELSKEYYQQLDLKNIQIPKNDTAHYMDYLDREEWKLNMDLLIYLKQRVFYYEKAGNVWYSKHYDPIQKRYSFAQTKDSELYNTNIYVDTGIEKKKRLKDLIDLCLKQFLTVRFVDFVPYSSVYPIQNPEAFFNLYMDNNARFYQPDLEINMTLVQPYLDHLYKIISKENDDVYKYILHTIQNSKSSASIR